MQPRPILTAQQTLSELYIENPSDLDFEGMINLYGGYYQEKPMSGADGRIIFKGNKVIITINSEISYAPKKRFVVAHELGHLLLHRNTMPMFNCDEAAFMDWYRGSSFETQANEFAAEILMPKEMFTRELKKIKGFDFNLIITLAKYFQTSVTSTVIRFLTAGSLPAAIVYSVNGIVQWQNFSTDFKFKRFKAPKGNPIPNDSVVYNILKGKAKPLEKEPILATYWFNVFDNQRDIYLYEECFAISSQNGVLSLLWVCEDY